MFDEFNKQFKLMKFLQDCNNFTVDIKNDYISYPEFLKYFNNLTTITKHNLIIGINFTYGWMPTILNFRSDNFINAITILNNAKKGVKPTVNQLDILKGLFNNSLVGTSKLLHFINPNIFAIWDSRVFRYLTNKEPYYSRIQDCNTYFSYLSFCKLITTMKEYNNAHISICDKIGYPMSKFRTAELIMYINGKITEKRK